VKVLKWLDDHFEESILAFLLILISCITLLQIIARNTTGSLSWPEEFCRFCWIWSVFLSVPYTIKNNNMLRVNIIVDMLPNVVRKIINLLVELIIGVTCGAAFYHSIAVEQGYIKTGEFSPAMEWPLSIALLCIQIGFALGTLRAFEQIIVQIKRFGEREKSTLELTREEAAEEAAAGLRAEGGADS